MYMNVISIDGNTTYINASNGEIDENIKNAYGSWKLTEINSDDNISIPFPNAPADENPNFAPPRDDYRKLGEFKTPNYFYQGLARILNVITGSLAYRCSEKVRNWYDLQKVVVVVTDQPSTVIKTNEAFSKQKRLT